MANGTVFSCNGTFLDSGKGLIFGHYAHNENFTFTICGPDSASLSLTFQSFCTELDFDSLRIFDGVDTFAQQLGPAYSGSQIPPTIQSSGHCLTFHFVSDANISCGGWRATWTSHVGSLPEVDPIRILNDRPNCGTQQVILDFSVPIPCDSVSVASFWVKGPRSNQVTAATPISCVNDSASQVLLQLSPGLTWSGDYEVGFLRTFRDYCDSVWTTSSVDTLHIRNCPLQLSLEADRDTICIGECIQIKARASSGDLGNYHYSWNTSPQDTSLQFVCPTQTTMYRVVLTDESGSVAATDSVTVYVRPRPTMPADSVSCQSIDSVTLVASPAGGAWQGPGLLDAGSGIFSPSLMGPGVHTLVYRESDGCENQLQFRVKAIHSGINEAACTGTDTFRLRGFQPLGGYWTGPGILDSVGIFDPNSNGTFLLTYHVDGCTADKTLFVDQISLPVTIDTICESSLPMPLSFHPPGGIWTGPGITDSITGIFSPQTARSGLHTLHYQLHGCSDSIQVFVQALSLGGNLIICPEAEPVWLGNANPPGGIWSGWGVIDSAAGIYDPSFAIGQGDMNDQITYTWGECFASRQVQIRETSVGIDTLWLCGSDPPFLLNWDHTRNRPYNGFWAGKGVTDPDYPGLFDPLIAGPGNHTLLFTANGCADSLTIRIRPNPILTDTTVCERAAPFPFRASTPGGSWYGEGIIHAQQGLFDPQKVGVGTHYVYYQSPQACLDSMPVQVTAMPEAKLVDFGTEFCHRDTLLPLQGLPAGGVFRGSGVVGAFFNPALADSGLHKIEYILGNGHCQSTDAVWVQVGGPIRLMADSYVDTLCYGVATSLQISATGGSGGNIRYLWQPGGQTGDTLFVRPDSTSVYSVTVYDGCSDSKTLDFPLVVKDSIEVVFSASDPVCPGTTGYVSATVLSPGLFLTEWQTDPLQYGDTLFAEAHYDYPLKVVDLVNGCSTIVHTSIPSSTFIKAAFSPNPNNECITTADPTIELLDLSKGGQTGTWNFGDGHFAPYAVAENPRHSYAAAGNYQLWLVLENEDHCTDTAYAEICVVPEAPRIFVPDAFSPNGDGVNDLFQVQGIGFLVYRIEVFNRWGRVVFQSRDPQASWDGTHNGVPLPEGVYAYSITGFFQSANPLIEYGPTLMRKKGSITLLR